MATVETVQRDSVTNAPVAQKSTNGAGNVLVKNASLVTQGIGAGGVINFSAASGEVGHLGDLTIYGLPYGDVMITKTGANAVAAVLWGIATNGMIFLSITALNALDSLNITAKNSNGDTITGNILYRLNGGAPISAAISAPAAPAFITLYTGQ